MRLVHGGDDLAADIDGDQTIGKVLTPAKEVRSPMAYCPRSSLPAKVLAWLADRLGDLLPPRPPGQGGNPPLSLEVRLDAVAAVILDGLSYRRAGRMVGISKAEVGDSLDLRAAGVQPPPGRAARAGRAVNRAPCQRLGVAPLARAAVPGPGRLPGRRRAHLPRPVVAPGTRLKEHHGHPQSDTARWLSETGSSEPTSDFAHLWAAQGPRIYTRYRPLVLFDGYRVVLLTGMMTTCPLR